MFDLKKTPQPGIEPGSPEGRGSLPFASLGDVIVEGPRSFPLAIHCNTAMRLRHKENY